MNETTTGNTLDAMIGKSVPTLSLIAYGSTGAQFKLPTDLLGKWTLIYFYPKDDTPGCTTQACSYRDDIGKFKELGAQIVGVSGDDLASHEAFSGKFHLNFPLLADTKGELRSALGVTSRDTFLVDPQGKVREVWRKVKPDATSAETLTAVKKYAAR